MAFSLEDFKGQIAQSGGVASGNLYKVFLPQITGFADTRDLNVLCTTASLPGRQIMTQDITHGTVMRKIASGYATTDITLTFYVMNDHKVRAYFEAWQNLAHNQSTKEVGWYDDYIFDVTIQHIQKGASMPILKKQLGIGKKIPSFLKNKLPKIGPIDFAQDEIELNAQFKDTPVYTCQLRECFPTTINEQALGNDQTGMMEFTVQLSYVDWISGRVKPDDNFLASATGAGINLLKNIF